SGQVLGDTTDLTIRSVIAAVSGAGVVMPSGAQTTIDRNAIDGNGGLGIDAGAGGVAANDPGDADGVQNFPLITAFNLAPTLTTVTVGLSSAPNAEYRVQLFHVQS